MTKVIRTTPCILLSTCMQSSVKKKSELTAPRVKQISRLSGYTFDIAFNLQQGSDRHHVFIDIYDANTSDA